MYACACAHSLALLRALSLSLSLARSLVELRWWVGYCLNSMLKSGIPFTSLAYFFKGLGVKGRDADSRFPC